MVACRARIHTNRKPAILLLVALLLGYLYRAGGRTRRLDSAEQHDPTAALEAQPHSAAAASARVSRSRTNPLRRSSVMMRPSNRCRLNIGAAGAFSLTVTFAGLFAPTLN